MSAIVRPKAYLTPADLDRHESSDYSKVGKVTAESVHKHTDKDWSQWVSLLDRAGARAWSYQELVAFLAKKYRLTPWWQQGVALGFEIATGRRQTGQDAKGRYMVTATKTLPRSARQIWEILASAAGQEIWLRPFAQIDLKPKVQFETTDGFFGEIRTIARHRRIRLYWQDPAWKAHTVLEVLLVSRPGSKSILVFNHTGILTLKIKTSLATRWRKAADEIAVLALE